MRRRRFRVRWRRSPFAGRGQRRVLRPWRTVRHHHRPVLVVFVFGVRSVHARLSRRRYSGQEPDGQSARRAALHGQFGLVQHGRLARKSGLLFLVGAAADAAAAAPAHARPGRSCADARAGRVGRTRTVVARARQVRVLRRLPGHYPRAGPPLFGIEQPERNAAMVMVMVVMVLPPRVRPGRTIVFAGRHGRSPLVLLLLDLGYLVRVPVASHVLSARLGLALEARHDPSELDVQPIVERLVRLHGLVVQQFNVTAARRVRVIVPGRPVH